jgi:hypothetical protein
MERYCPAKACEMRIMRRSLRRILILIATYFTAANAAGAQGQSSSAIQATARLERSDIQLGQSVSVTVEVKGSDGPPEIAIPASEDCFVTLAGRAVQSPALAGINRQFAIGGNGMAGSSQALAESLQKMTEKLANDPLLKSDALKGIADPDLQKQVQAAMGNLGLPKSDTQAFVYHVHPKRTGAVVIPPFTVKSKGETSTTKPMELHVSPTRSQDQVRLAMSLSNTRPVVGQEVQLDIDVLVRREQVSYGNQTYPHLPLKGVQLTLPPLEVGPMELVRPLEDILKEHAPAAGHRGYRINHLPTEAVFDKESNTANEEIGWYRRRLAVAVRFKQAGRASLSAAGVSGEAWIPGSPANRRLGGRWQPFVAVSDPLEIEVRELPASRPRDFSGNVGELRVTTSASQTKMTAGTPFKLTVRLEGERYLPHSGSLDLASKPEFTRRFRVLLDQDRAMSDTLREVTYTLRPANSEVKEVPVVSATYFDSKRDEFRTAKSAPIPLEVTGSANVVETPESGPEKTEPTNNDRVPLEDLAAAQQRGWLTRNVVPVVALVVAGILVAGVLGGGRALRHVRAAKANHATLQLHQRAAGDVRRQLASRVQSVGEVRELLQQALRARFGLPGGEITPQDAAEQLRQAGTDTHLANACAELLASCAAAEFAPGVDSVSVPDLAAQAEVLIGRIAKAA